ncbi:TIR domain-containing protein [Sphingomonas sp. LR55]|uniref:TIR domain-containing protein n=1 Tax=Sphingomonas sp. LR55 TaxID=3050231 RepID=UPI002FDFDC40
MSAVEELFEAVKEFERIASIGVEPSVEGPIQKRIDACNQVAEAFSKSWLGYHSRVYQEGLKARPGARFDSQWGLSNMRFGESRGQWGEYDPEGVKAEIKKLSGNHDFTAINRRVSEADKKLERIKGDVVSILSTAIAEKSDDFLAKLKTDIEGIESASYRDAILFYRPSGQFISSDTIALTAGLVTPPHIEMLAEVVSMTTVFGAANNAADITRKAASHLERRAKSAKKTSRVGTNVFLGHGRSLLWRELKDFVEDRLHLPVDEFNRVPVAGLTNIARLSEMLDAAAVAFVIMTAEDETAEGKLQARMNVIHEVGLFQGRLGFTRGIVMLEEGTEEFSNVQGLGQIRFPKGQISAAFEQVRLVLEREGLLETN